MSSIACPPCRPISENASPVFMATHARLFKKFIVGMFRVYYVRVVRLVAQLCLVFVCGIAFLTGGSNLCATMVFSTPEVKKSCHQEVPAKTAAKEQTKKEKQCCSLHCYNPAHLEPLVQVVPPATLAILIKNEDIPFSSMVISPPLPPPRN